MYDVWAVEPEWVKCGGNRPNLSVYGEQPKEAQQSEIPLQLQDFFHDHQGC